MHKPLKRNKKELTREQREQLLRKLQVRFEKNMDRHQGLEWAKIQARLDANAEKLWSLSEMESTGVMLFSPAVSREHFFLHV